MTYAALLTGTLGCCASLFALWMLRTGAIKAAAQREETEKTCERRADELPTALDALERNRQSSEEMLRDGRLNRSTRSEALRLLRSGVTPEKVSAAVGMAKREVRLLARVSEMLSR